MWSNYKGFACLGIGLVLSAAGCATDSGHMAPIRNLKVFPATEPGLPSGDKSGSFPSSSAVERARDPQRRVAQKLLDEAAVKVEQGQYEAAVAIIERGLRVDPRNPMLWLSFAQIRLKQNKPQHAEQLANKSLALAAGNRDVIFDSWRIIRESRAARGDSEGVKSAQDILNSYGSSF